MTLCEIGFFPPSRVIMWLLNESPVYEYWSCMASNNSRGSSGFLAPLIIRELLLGLVELCPCKSCFLAFTETLLPTATHGGRRKEEIRAAAAAAENGLVTQGVLLANGHYSYVCVLSTPL